MRGNSLVLSVLFGFFAWDNLNENFSTAPSWIDLVSRQQGGGSNSGGGGQPDWGFGPRVNMSWYKPDLFFGAT